VFRVRGTPFPAVRVLSFPLLYCESPLELKPNPHPYLSSGISVLGHLCFGHRYSALVRYTLRTMFFPPAALLVALALLPSWCVIFLSPPSSPVLPYLPHSRLDFHEITLPPWFVVFVCCAPPAETLFSVTHGFGICVSPFEHGFGLPYHLRSSLSESFLSARVQALLLRR